MPRPPAASGFTLIELVLVAVVLGILLVGTVPKFSHTVERLRVERAAFELAQLMRYARERAVSDGQAMSWVWDDRTRRARIERDQPDGGETTGERRFMNSFHLPAHVVVELLRNSERVDRVHFFPDGTSEPATLSLTLGQIVYTMEIDEATGQPLLAAGTPAR